MNPEWLPLLGIALVICLAAAMQSAVGFGYALFATPLLIWAGLPLPSTIVTVALCACLQSSLGVYHLRQAVPWRLAAGATLVRLAALLAGLWMLRHLSQLSTAAISIVVGTLLVALVTLQLAVRPRPRASVHWTWTAIAFVASGVLAGVSGMGGPPLALWTMAHDWPVQKMRGFLFAVFAATVPVQLALLLATFRDQAFRALLLSAWCVPFVLLGTAIGLPLGNRLPRHRLRLFAYAILLALGANAVVTPLIQRGW